MATFGNLRNNVGFRNLVGLKNDAKAIRELLDPNAPPPPPSQTQVVTKEKKMSLFDKIMLSLMVIFFIVIIIFMITHPSDERFNTLRAADVAWDADPEVVSNAPHNFKFAKPNYLYRGLNRAGWVVNALDREARPRWFRV